MCSRPSVRSCCAVAADRSGGKVGIKVANSDTPKGGRPVPGDEEGAAVEDVRGMRRGDSKRISKMTPLGWTYRLLCLAGGGSFLSRRGGFGYHNNKSEYRFFGYLIKHMMFR